MERDQIKTGLTEINGIVEFLNDIYRPCKILGMEPSNSVSWIQDLLKNAINENKAL